MQSKAPERGGTKSAHPAQPAQPAQPAKPRIVQVAIDVARSQATSVIGLSLGASLGVLIACAEPTSLVREARRAGPVFLNATAAAAVRTVLADVSFRIDEAIEDDAARGEFDAVLARLTASIESGMLDQADVAVADARASLASASTADADGSGDADRAAIALAIGVATEEITNARIAAGGQ